MRRLAAPALWTWINSENLRKNPGVQKGQRKRPLTHFSRWGRRRKGLAWRAVKGPLVAALVAGPQMCRSLVSPQGSALPPASVPAEGRGEGFPSSMVRLPSGASATGEQCPPHADIYMEL